MIPAPARLKLNFLDPEDGYRLVRTVTLDWDMEEALLHRQGLLCDGARLIMLGPTEATVPRTKGMVAFMDVLGPKSSVSALRV